LVERELRTNLGYEWFMIRLQFEMSG